MRPKALKSSLMVGPIDGNAIPHGGLSESIAASSSMILSGLEKELRDKNISINLKTPQLKLEELNKLLDEVKSSTALEPIQKRQEGQSREGETDFGRGGQREQKQPSGKTAGTQTGKAVVSSEGTNAKGERVKVDPRLLRDFMIVLLKQFLGMPVNEIQQIQSEYRTLKDQLARETSIEYVSTKENELLRFIKAELVESVKNRLLQILSQPNLSVNAAIGKNDSKIIQEYFLNGENPDLSTLSSEELRDAAQAVGLNLDYWISYWNYDKIKINAKQELELQHVLDSTAQTRRQFVDEYRLFWINRFFAKKWTHRILLGRKIAALKKNLKILGYKNAEFAELELQARRLSWLKALRHLKQSHLSRVFAVSSDEFERYSKEIRRFTRLARSLAVDFGQKGVQLIETNLKDLAIQTARYKIELLHSLQKIENNPDRVEELHQIENTLKKLG